MLNANQVQTQLIDRTLHYSHRTREVTVGAGLVWEKSIVIDIRYSLLFCHRKYQRFYFFRC